MACYNYALITDTAMLKKIAMDIVYFARIAAINKRYDPD